MDRDNHSSTNWYESTTSVNLNETTSAHKAKNLLNDYRMSMVATTQAYDKRRQSSPHATTTIANSGTAGTMGTSRHSTSENTINDKQHMVGNPSKTASSTMANITATLINQMALKSTDYVHSKSSASSAANNGSDVEIQAATSYYQQQSDSNNTALNEHSNDAGNHTADDDEDQIASQNACLMQNCKQHFHFIPTFRTSPMQ
jgi:hypothetical protein